MNPFVYRRRVEFADTDMAGMMHFTNLFRFMESAEHAFLRSLGFSVTMNSIHPDLGLPRVHAEAEFRRPFYFEDEVEITLIIKEKKRKTITYAFELRKLGECEIAAKGTMTVVCVRRSADGKMISCPLPFEFSKCISIDTNED